jgi:hypothetical protein
MAHSKLPPCHSGNVFEQRSSTTPRISSISFEYSGMLKDAMCTYRVLARDIDHILLFAVVCFFEWSAEPAVVVRLARLVEGRRYDVVTWIKMENYGVAFFGVDGLRFKLETFFTDVDDVDLSAHNCGHSRSKQGTVDMHIWVFLFPFWDKCNWVELYSGANCE